MPKKKTKPLLIIGGIAALIALSLLEPELNLPSLTKKEKADFVFENMIMTHFDNGIKKWDLTAERADVFNKQNHTKMQTVKGHFFQDEIAIIAFEAPSGIYNLDGADILLNEGSATVNMENRLMTIQSENLTWSADDNNFRGNGFSIIETGPYKLEGYNFEVDIPIRYFVMSDRSTITISQ